MKHTPGPWVPMVGCKTGFARGIRAGNRNVINFGGISTPCSAEGQANARLIIAAPYLLEALTAFRTSLYFERNTEEVKRLTMAAIAKAEGK